MTKAQSEAAKYRYQRESVALCPHCRGKGLVIAPTATERARKGGNRAYINSLQPGALSMSARGKKGGRPRALTLQDLDAGILLEACGTEGSASRSNLGKGNL